MASVTAVYGCDTLQLIHYVHSASDPPALQQILVEYDKVMQQLKHHLVKTQ